MDARAVGDLARRLLCKRWTSSRLGSPSRGASPSPRHNSRRTIGSDRRAMSTALSLLTGSCVAFATPPPAADKPLQTRHTPSCPGHRPCSLSGRAKSASRSRLYSYTAAAQQEDLREYDHRAGAADVSAPRLPGQRLPGGAAGEGSCWCSAGATESSWGSTSPLRVGLGPWRCGMGREPDGAKRSRHSE